MNVKFKNTYDIPCKKKNKPMVMEPLSSHLSLENTYRERPFKNNSQNLSFKGLSSFLYKQANDIPYNSDEILNIAKEYLGSSATELFNSVKDSKLAKKLFTIEQGKVTFYKKTIPHLIYDGIIYPIKILPADILNGIVDALRKIKPLENWANNLYHSKFFRNIRQRSKTDSKVNALRGIFETIHGLKGKSKDEISSKLFQQSTKMFDPKTGNYDTKHERSLNRVVSGAIPAFFLANDAYNLSMMCNDNKKDAKKEQKTRFKQEVSRVGVTAYLTLITMGALQKHVNNSKFGVMLMTGSTVLFTEMFSRLTNGKHITRLSPEKAKEINAQNGISFKEEDKPKNEDYKSVFFKSGDETPVKQPEIAKPAVKNEKKQEPLMSFGTIMKASAYVIGTGLALKGLRKFKPVDKVFNDLSKSLNDIYKKLTLDPQHKISQEEFNKIIEKLRSIKDSNKKEVFGELANKYEEIAKANAKDGHINLGQKDKKSKLAVDFVIATFKFIFNTIKIPYTIVEKGVKLFTKKAPAAAKDANKLNQEALARSIERIGKEALQEKFDAEKFKSFVNDNIMKAFNVDNMSNVSNSELANLAKTSATVATIWFLMTDNYNMVMLKSNGEDKEGAQLKSKERFVQEGSRLFYQTLLISLFNGTFRSQYNGSLFGMSWVTSICTFVSENLNRKSIGMPVGTHSRDELLTIERKKEETTGLLKGYYNFMSRLTGKKSLAEQTKAKQTDKK